MSESTIVILLQISGIVVLVFTLLLSFLKVTA